VRTGPISKIIVPNKVEALKVVKVCPEILRYDLQQESSMRRHQQMGIFGNETSTCPQWYLTSSVKIISSVLFVL